MRSVFIIYSTFFDFEKKQYTIGGIQTYIRKLLPIFIECGYLPCVLTPGLSTEMLYLDNGAQIMQVQTNFKDTRQLVDMAERIGNPAEDLILFATSTGVRRTSFKHSISIQHGIYWDVDTIHGHRVKNIALGTSLRFAQAIQQIKWHRQVDVMVCVDNNYTNWLRAVTGSVRLPYVYIPNSANPPALNEAREDDGFVRIVFARRFDVARGSDLLIAAVPSVLRRHPNALLTIAGTGPCGERLHEAFDGFSQVNFTQYDANESIEFHSKYDIAIVPSIASEGTSLSLLEAMAAGCACIATDVGGMSNILLNGHNGIQIQPDVTSLSEALEGLILNSEKRNYIGRMAWQTIVDSFSDEEWSDRWRNLINRIGA